MKLSYNEQAVQEALHAIANGMSQNKAELEYGVPRSTLQNRLKGIPTRQQAHAHEQRLSPTQEDHLAEWILNQECLGKGPTHQQIRIFAGRILDVKGDAKPLGKRWMAGFLRRNPILKTKKQFQIDSARVNGATTEVIKKWWEYLTPPRIKAIKPENRWNMDEAGIMEGIGDNGLVVGSVHKRFIQKKTPGSRAWTSFIESISAVGRNTKPLVIFKGKSVQQQWFDANLQKLDGWKFTSTENGWTTDATAIEWLEKVFIPQTAPRDPSEPRLLILDGHGSHETTEFLWLCYSNNIHMLFLPPHSSHILQPLDLAVFSSLKKAYRRHVGLLDGISDATPIGKRNFINCYHKARIESITAQNIKSGWRASGLWPLNRAKPLMSRLLLENSNNQQDSASKRKANDALLDWDANQSILEVSTPTKAKELREIAYQTSQLGKGTSPTSRTLLRKISKGWDQRDFIIAQHEKRIADLEARVVQLQPRKRRKVQTSPNSKFAGIREIRKAQIEAGDRHILEEAEDISEELSSTLSHITIN